MTGWLFLAIAIACNTAANVLVKAAGMRTLDSVSGTYVSPAFVLGVLLFATNLLFYVQALKQMPLAIGYPVLVGGSMVGVNLLAVLLFGEFMDLRHYLGMAMVFAGIVLLSV